MAAPGVAHFTREFVQSAWTRHPFTKNFNHLKPVPKEWLPRVNSWMRDLIPPNPVVKQGDRIKHWNIVPGDRVRVRGHKNSHIMEVAQVNKLQNLVRLREIKEEKGEGEQEDELEDLDKLLKVHYSRLQLYWRHMTVEGKPDPVPIFVTRIGRGKETWCPTGGSEGGFITWKRYPEKTTPQLPKEEFKKQPIPWPTVEVQRIRKDKERGYVAENYITPAEVVGRVTYDPPNTEALLNMMSPKLPRVYTTSLYNPEHKLIDRTVRERVKYTHTPEGPMEAHITRELSNPYSRAKRQARWKARHEYRKLLLSQIMKRELSLIGTRSRREARADAVFLWKTKLADEDAEERVHRKVKRGDKAREDKKRAIRLRKLRRKEERLKKLVLLEGPNQIIPGSQPAAASPAGA